MTRGKRHGRHHRRRRRLGPAGPQHPAHGRRPVLHAARPAEDVQLPAGQGAARLRADDPVPGAGGPAGGGRRRAAPVRPLHPPGRLRPLRADGLRLLDGPRPAQPVPAAQRRRRGDPLLLRLPLHRLRRPRPVEPRRHLAQAEGRAPSTTRRRSGPTGRRSSFVGCGRLPYFETAFGLLQHDERCCSPPTFAHAGSRASGRLEATPEP